MRQLCRKEWLMPSIITTSMPIPAPGSSYARLFSQRGVGTALPSKVTMLDRREILDMYGRFPYVGKELCRLLIDARNGWKPVFFPNKKYELSELPISRDSRFRTSWF